MTTGKGVGHFLIFRQQRLVGRANGHHKAATDAQVLGFLEQQAVGIKCAELHAVGVFGHGFAAVHQDVVFFLEADGLGAQQRQHLAVVHLVDQCRHRVHVDCVGCEAHQAQHHRNVRSVALAGGAQ